MDSTLLQLVQVAAVMFAVLGSLATMLLLDRVVDVPGQVVVLAVVLAVTLRRIRPEGRGGRSVVVVEVVLVGLAATGTGRLLVMHPWIGGPLLVVGLSVGILTRRYGSPVRQAGRIVSLPFVALLVSPAPVVDGRPTGILWAPVAGLVGLAWTLLAQHLVAQHLVARHLLRRGATAQPVRVGPSAPATRRRLDAPTRMAAQMALGVGAALLAGHLLFGGEWAWTVLSAFLVASGNRGRGDVVHKAGLRVVGGAAGTLVATLATAHVPAGHRGTLVVLFAVLAVGLFLRRYGYGWWAVAVTSVVALLHAYYGQAGASLLGDRLLGVLTGSAIGVAVAWFVLPVRTSDVVRRRIFDCLAALTDDLAPDRVGPAACPEALARLAELAPTLRSHRRTLGRRHADHPYDTLAALTRLAELPTDPVARRRLRGATVWVRRSAAGRDVGDPPALPADLAAVHRVLTAGRGNGGPRNSSGRATVHV